MKICRQWNVKHAIKYVPTYVNTYIIHNIAQGIIGLFVKYTIIGHIIRETWTKECILIYTWHFHRNYICGREEFSQEGVL